MTNTHWRRLILGAAAAALAAWGAGAANVAMAQQKVTWRLQTIAAAGTLEYKDLAQAFADRARQLSGGRIDIQVFAAGSLMKSNEVPEAVGKGTLDMAHTFLVYLSGKEPALKAVNEWPAMVEPLQGVAWTYHGGGMAIMREITEKHGMHFLGVSPLAGEHIWSKKPLKSVADLNGLKMRAAAVAADSFKKLGAAVVALPGEEVYSGLQRGIIDATEFTTLSVNYGLGLHEVTKYVIQPTYSGGGTYDWVVNKSKWDALPADLRAILEVALNEVSYQYWLKNLADEQRIIGEMKKKGVQFITWSDKDMKTLEKARISIMRDVYAKESALYAKKLESQLKFLDLLGYEEAK